MTRATTALKKSLKYILILLMVLVFLIIGLLLYVLHTESGTKLAIEQGIKWADIDVSYDHLSGSLSDGLTINNFNYQSDAIDIKVNNISYQSDWLWFDRHLTLNQAQVDEVVIALKPSGEKASQSEPFSGFSMPLSIDVEGLSIHELTLVNNQQDVDDINEDSSKQFNTINLIILKADIERQSAAIQKLNIEAPEFKLDTSGQIEFGSGLAYDLKTQWQVNIEQQKLAGSGPIKGNLQQVDLNQNFKLANEQIDGIYQLTGSISELLTTPRFDLLLQSDQTEVSLNQQIITVKQLQADLNGLLEDYKINLTADVEGANIVPTNADANTINDADSTPQSISYPSSEIKISATGNTQHIQTQNAQLTTPQGSVDLTVDAQWQPNLKITSQVNIESFNPEQILKNWPGNINGSINLELISSDQGISITTQDNQLTGELKDQQFELTGTAKYATETFEAEQLRLQLGENSLVVNGQVKPEDVALKAEVNWTDLSHLGEDIGGEVKGTVDLSGDYQAPKITAQVAAQQLTFADQIIEQINIDTSGQWGQKLNTTINIEQAILAGQSIDSIHLVQTGWLDDHRLEIKLNGQKFSTQLTALGEYNATAQSTDVIWQGQLLSHKLTVETDKTISLQAPIQIKYGDLISIEKGCWQGVEAGQLCVELNDIQKGHKNYQGSLTVDAFSLVPLQVVMPETLVVKGQLNGAADFELGDDEFNIKSNISLQNGEIIVLAQSVAAEPIYQTEIKTLTIDAKTNNKDINININSELSDQSSIDLTAHLSSLDDNPMEIESSFSGEFNNTEMIKQLTEEISELEGQVKFDGSITGELSRPRISLDLSQPEGYVTLTRLGTVIEQLKLNVSTEDVSVPAYEIIFSGQNLADINQGSIKSSGVFSLADDTQDDWQWQYKGDITGDNFMLLNLAEANFKISPKLSIVANDQSTAIEGDLVIDSGRVTVQQLPASTVKNSSDVIIHRPNTEEPNTYPVVLNIKANIKEAIELDVIGLKSELTGSIQLIQNKHQALTAKGILNLTDGTYEIYGQELTIKNGELTFTGPIDNPRINVKASRKSLSGDVVAGVELGGTVNNLRSTLYSEPSLSDIEKLSYIMTGRGLENSGGLDGEQLQQAAIVMGLNQSSPVFKQIQSQFGIDVLTVREAASTADTVVEAGKQLGEKLYVSYNQGLFNRLGFWLLKYRINDFLNLETTQGEDQSVELVYTRKADIPNKAQDKAQEKAQDKKDGDK